MRTSLVLVGTAALALLSLVVGAASICRAADITYDVNQAVGVGRVTGDIVTDGKIGVLAQADILDWNLLLNNSLSTFDLLGPLSGSNSGVVNSGLNLTATASQLLFNFSGTSYVLFQNPSPGSGLSSFCLETSAIDCSHGAGEFLQVGNQNNPPGGQFTALSGTHVIATTTTTALNVTGRPCTMPIMAPALSLVVASHLASTSRIAPRA